MSKIDQLRRQREEQHARQEKQAPPAKSNEPAKAAPALAPPLAPPSAKSDTASDAPEGACSICGKVRALQNGLVTNHQKGLGKMCPGSRKEPA